MLTTFARERTFRPICTLRLYQAARGRSWGKLLTPFIKLAHRHVCARAAVDIPIELSIGPGLSLLHGWGTVINQKARIGSNVTLFHGVTLGRGDRISQEGVRTSGYPTIGDNVWIGPNATIVGDVTIGCGSRILAGAVITTDIPPRSMVAGNPARIIKENCAPDVLNPAPLGATAVLRGESGS